MVIAGKTAVTIDPAQHGLKQHEMTTSTVVFMIFCLCAAGCYGIEEMIPQAGPGLTLVMLIVLPFLWSTPMGLVAAELGSALPQVGYGLAIGMWVYSGYESMSTVAGELKDPQVIPRATLITVPLIMATYILPTMGGLASLGNWSEWASSSAARNAVFPM